MKKYYYAALVTFLYIPIVTITGELWKPLKDFLQNIFWHHWLGKGIILISLFLILTFIFHLAFRKNISGEEKDEKYLSWITGITILGSIALIFFFTYEYLKHV